jgi:hypothetical protein
MENWKWYRGTGTTVKTNDRTMASRDGGFKQVFYYENCQIV